MPDCDIAQIRREDGREWYEYFELNGAKMWITNGHVAGLFCLYARTPAGSTGFSRDKLLLHLWPESDEERARHALKQAVYSVRRDLGQMRKVALYREAAPLFAAPAIRFDVPFDGFAIPGYLRLPPGASGSLPVVIVLGQGRELPLREPVSHAWTRDLHIRWTGPR